MIGTESSRNAGDLTMIDDCLLHNQIKARRRYRRINRNLICAVEEKFDIETSDRTIKTFKTVGDVITFIEKQ